MGQNQSQSQLAEQVVVGAALVVAEETRVAVGAALAIVAALVVAVLALVVAGPVLGARKKQLVVGQVRAARELGQKTRAAIVLHPSLNKIDKEFGDASPSPRNNS